MRIVVTITNPTKPPHANDMNRDELLDMLCAYMCRSPQLDPADYAGAWDCYRRDQRENTRDKNDGLAMLHMLRPLSSITAEAIREQLTTRNRLYINERGTLSYTAGQMASTEFRAAVATVFARLLRGYWCARWDETGAEWHTAGDYIAKHARQEFGRGLQSRWFR